MQDLVFALNSTVPVFLLMVLGYLLNRLGLFDDTFASKANAYVFKVALPAKLFVDLAPVDFTQMWDTRFVVFCFSSTLVCILFAIALSRVWHDRSVSAEFVQSSYRSSAALLGIAFIQNIYGSSGMSPLMIIGSVPLYNIMAVTVLTVMSPDAADPKRPDIKKTLLNIARNPILLGIVVGLLWSLLKLPLPNILFKAVNNVGNTATPMGLMAMGALFAFSDVLGKARPVITASALKLVGFAAVFVPAAVLLGFRDAKLVAILIMLGSPTTVSSYIMARSMGHEGTVSSGTVMLTTLLSAFTLTAWLFVLRAAGLI